METLENNEYRTSQRGELVKDSKLETFLITELKDIYGAEKQIIKALPKMHDAASSPRLKQAFDDHLQVTFGQISRLEEVFDILGIEAEAENCEAMEGIIDEGETIIDETEDDSSTRDVGLILAAQKVEHYEIASYGTLVQLCRTLGHDDIAEILKSTLNEEVETDRLLTEIAEGDINYMASEETEQNVSDDNYEDYESNVNVASSTGYIAPQMNTGYTVSSSSTSDTANYRSTSTETDSNARFSTMGMLTASFEDPQSAEKAYKALESRGYTKDEVNVAMSDKTRDQYFTKGEPTALGKAMEGVGTGSAIGGTLGAVIGAVAAIGTNLLIPGLGLVIAGPIAGALAGAGAGGLAGGLAGALIGWGLPEEYAKSYEEGIKKGQIVIGVHPKNEADASFIDQIWRTNNGNVVAH